MPDRDLAWPGNRECGGPGNGDPFARRGRAVSPR